MWWWIKGEEELEERVTCVLEEGLTSVVQSVSAAQMSQQMGEPWLWLGCVSVMGRKVGRAGVVATISLNFVFSIIFLKSQYIVGRGYWHQQWMQAHHIANIYN